MIRSCEYKIVAELGPDELCLRKIRIYLVAQSRSFIVRFQFFLPIHLMAKLCIHHLRSEIIYRLQGEYRSELFVEFEFSMKSGSRCTLVHVHVVSVMCC